jgi:hypothetical protein
LPLISRRAFSCYQTDGVGAGRYPCATANTDQLLVEINSRSEAADRPPRSGSQVVQVSAYVELRIYRTDLPAYSNNGSRSSALAACIDSS